MVVKMCMVSVYVDAVTKIFQQNTVLLKRASVNNMQQTVMFWLMVMPMIMIVLRVKDGKMPVCGVTAPQTA